MPSSRITLHLRPGLRDEIARLAKRQGRSFSEVAQDLLDEALRHCPGIYFADEPTERVAKVSGTGLGVWEVIRDYLESERSASALQKLFPQLSAAQIEASLLYYSKNPTEIDQAIAENAGLTWDAVEARLGALLKRG